MAKCVQCRCDTDWTSKSGYCKDCAKEILRAQDARSKPGYFARLTRYTDYTGTKTGFYKFFHLVLLPIMIIFRVINLFGANSVSQMIFAAVQIIVFLLAFVLLFNPDTFAFIALAASLLLLAVEVVKLIISTAEFSGSVAGSVYTGMTYLDWAVGVGASIATIANIISSAVVLAIVGIAGTYFIRRKDIFFDSDVRKITQNP